MKVDDQGWLTAIRHHPSPNFDQRPGDAEINLLVIHNISLPPEQFGDNWILDFFCNELDPKAHPYFTAITDLTVSAHVLIRRDGEIIQFVSFNDRAWHAGASCFEGRERCNDFSIGIELEGSDNQPFEEQQYQRLSELTHALIDHYPTLSKKMITGHCNIAPERKTDPGPFFNWEHYFSML
ncbi:MAG: 1,6-anhydro-N-acetylmuramyl-L-alanine amidase AmpD [Gammaproteobacteria bacterium]|nr:1,6-anhydro-N-acetylmuramyl-L-alanine amidase AmpD [Gammaproteobacteria bacterium]NNJ90905.1 1,6-anhydro-N-acetylmuramyl-L-alanine amidase AmpD [Gammaproteobacteria bacterium]